MPPRDTQDKDRQLSALIQLKRREKPDAEFWTRFEQDFRSRQLSALVGTQPWHRRILVRLSPLARGGLTAAGVASALAISLISAHRNGQEPTAASSSPAMESLDAPQPLFVVNDAAEPTQSETDLAQSSRPVYGLTILSNRPAPQNYTLISSPLTLSTIDHEAAESGSSLGAKIIRASNPF